MTGVSDAGASAFWSLTKPVNDFRSDPFLTCRDVCCPVGMRWKADHEQAAVNKRSATTRPTHVEVALTRPRYARSTSPASERGERKKPLRA